jgi:hypothetical protein
LIIHNQKKAILATVKIRLITISHLVSSPEPKTNGSGSIKIILPTLPDLPKTIETTAKTAIQTNTKVIPKGKN